MPKSDSLAGVTWSIWIDVSHLGLELGDYPGLSRWAQFNHNIEEENRTKGCIDQISFCLLKR